MFAKSVDRINMRISPEMKHTIEQACQITGQSVSQFILPLAYERAKSILEEETIWRVNSRDWNRMLYLLDNPGDPTPELVELLKLGDELDAH